MKKLLMRVWREEEGQDLTEYALLLVLIALGAITAMSGLASTINSVFLNAQGKLGSQ